MYIYDVYCFKKAKKTSKLPRDLQGLMGEANMNFARGVYEEAVKMCMEVIRLGKIAVIINLLSV